MAKLQANIGGYSAIYVDLGYLIDGAVPIGRLYMMKPKFKTLKHSLWNSLNSAGHKFYRLDGNELANYNAYAEYINAQGEATSVHQFITKQIVGGLESRYSWTI